MTSASAPGPRDETSTEQVDSGTPNAAPSSVVRSAARHLEALRLLNEVAAELLAAEDAASLVERVAPRFRAFLAADVWLHYRAIELDDGSTRLRLQAAGGLDAATRATVAELALDQMICGITARQRRPTYVENLRRVPYAGAELLRSLGIRAYACHPLLAAGRLVGTLSFGTRSRDAFDEQDRHVIETLAHYAAIAWDRLHTTERLAASEARYRDLTDTIPQVIWASDADGRATYFNRRWCEFTGQTPESAARADLLHFVHPDDRQGALEAWRRATTLGTVFTAEYRLRRSDGAYRWHLTHAVPVCEHGRVVRWCGSLLDIHDRKRAEAALRASEQRLRQAERAREALLEAERAARIEADRAARLKDDFLATISHELRTPLNAILGWTRLLRRPAADPSLLKEGLRVIDRNARVQAQLISDLLDVNRIVSGKLVLEREPLHVDEVVRAALETVATAAAEKRQRLETRLGGQELPEVHGDFARLQQVVWNLLANAIKFSPEGARIEVTTRRRGADVEIVVADEGEGIEPAFLPHIFERFSQADSSTGRRHGGLGLGLAIVRQLAQMHRGSVAAASDGPGRGTTFTVTLPGRAVTDEASGTGRWRVDRRDFAPALQGVRVLLVDDQLDALEFLRRALAEQGAEPVVAGSTSAALAELARAMPAALPHVLVSDIGMPGMDGYELIRHVRSTLDLDARALPAIALTAFAREEDHRAALAAGFQAHVTKPVQLSELYDAILRLAQRPPTPALGAPDGKH
jgi:PAS domain S-box-containing protein